MSSTIRRGSCLFEARPTGFGRVDEYSTTYFLSFNEHAAFCNFYNPDEILEIFLNLFAIKLRQQ